QRQANGLFRSIEAEGCDREIVKLELLLAANQEAGVRLGENEPCLHADYFLRRYDCIIESTKDTSQGDSSSSSGERRGVCPSPPKEHIGGVGVSGATCRGNGEGGRRDTAGPLGRQLRLIIARRGTDHCGALPW